MKSKHSVVLETALAARKAVRPSTRDYLDQLTSKMPKDVLDFHGGMQYGEQQKYLTYDVPEKTFPDHIDLLQITDVQFGHVECKYDRVLEYRDWVLAEPFRYMLWVGDMVDAHALWSPGSSWDNLFDPMSQLMRFVEIWAPARHRILGYVSGNHERRAIPGFGNLGNMIAYLLKIPHSDGRQLIDLYYGAHNPFKISLWHGMGGARTKGTVAQILDRFMQIGDSQLYLMGHVHKAMVIPDFMEVREQRGKKIKIVKSIGAVGSSFLGTWGSYGEVAGYNSSDVMMANTRVELDGHWEVKLR